MLTLSKKACKEQQQRRYTIIMCGFPSPRSQSIWRFAVSITAAHSLQNARLMRMWFRSLNAKHTSLCGAIKKTFLLSHMKDMAQLEECGGRSDEGHKAVCSTCAPHNPNVKWLVRPNYKKLWCNAASLGLNSRFLSLPQLNRGEWNSMSNNYKYSLGPAS